MNISPLGVTTLMTIRLKVFLSSDVAANKELLLLKKKRIASVVYRVISCKIRSCPPGSWHGGEKLGATARR